MILLVVIDPNVVAHTPNPGYTGPDEFEYEGSGPGREGRPVLFSVRIQVRVVGPDGPAALGARESLAATSRELIEG